MVGINLVLAAIIIANALAFVPYKCAHLSCLSDYLISTKLAESEGNDVDIQALATNVLGTQLRSCCKNVRGSGIGTGYYRNGFCATGEQDLGRHTVCVQVTDRFLAFSKSVGNDLSTPIPQYMFPGLKEGDIWCLCAQRWVQAHEAGAAPKLFLRSTHEKTLSFVDYDTLSEYAIDIVDSEKELAALNEQRERMKKLL